MPASSPQHRKLIAQIAAHESWSKTDNRSDRTAPARRAFLDSFEHEVDPDGVLAPDERARRAESKRRAHFARMALRSAEVRRRKAKAS